MEDEELQELRRMLSAHANVVRCMATLNKMSVANDNARSKGEDDPYGPGNFAEVESEVQEYVEELAS